MERSVSPDATPAAPARPVLVYDADCGFCRRRVARWQDLTGDRVEYVASRDAAARFPGVGPQTFDTAVWLVGPDGTITTGAEAVFGALATAPGHGWKRWAYRNVGGFAATSEWIYRFVAGHRPAFSALTRVLCGLDPAPDSWLIARWLFLRLLGVTFLIAFVSLWTQVRGLIGSDGILPVAEHLEWVTTNLGASSRWKVPTLCWIDPGDGYLVAQCAAGVVLSLLLVAGVAPVPVLLLLWLTYLSLCAAGQAFLSFQWDTLLLETGFVAMFLAPADWRPRLTGQRRPPAVGLWLERWLLFKLMFLSGVTKLLSGDPTWRGLTALDVHYETQPLPSWIGYYAHQLPEWFQRLSVVNMYVIEIGLPFLIFGPRRLRHVAAAGLIGLQILIAATGSYCFFNLLAAILCLLLLDDRLLRRGLPRRFADRFTEDRSRPPRPRGWRYATLTAAVVIFTASGLAFLREMVRTQQRPMLPDAVVAVLDTANRHLLLGGGNQLLRWIEPFRTINGYGLFRVMTTERPEIVIEASDDGVTWREYAFRWKPGDVTRRPRFAAPHQPRLDWQMWFAALNPTGNAYWLLSLRDHLLQGTPEVLALLGENPFEDQPPRLIRLMLYRYEFTDPATKRRTGAWWQRELIGTLTRPESRQPGE